jgi:hypothetical protein
MATTYTLVSEPPAAGVQYASATDLDTFTFPAHDNPPWYEFTVSLTSGTALIGFDGRARVSLVGPATWKANVKVDQIEVQTVSAVGYVSWSRQ